MVTRNLGQDLDEVECAQLIRSRIGGVKTVKPRLEFVEDQDRRRMAEQRLDKVPTWNCGWVRLPGPHSPHVGTMGMTIKQHVPDCWVFMLVHALRDDHRHRPEWNGCKVGTCEP